MAEMNLVRDMCGRYYQGVAITVPCVSFYRGQQTLMLLQMQQEVDWATGYFSPELQMAVFIIRIETPFSCDALAAAAALTGPGAVLHENK